jgi:hypothetical protein
VQLYSGSEATPTMLDEMMLGFSGPIPLLDFMTGAADYSLTVTPVSTPEPASLPLLVSGIVALLAMRKKRILAR